jgi:DNA-binding transcriptional MocR family regulator
VLKLVDNTCRDSFDLFYGLFKYNKHSAEQIQRLREAFANVERQLAAKEAYLAARSEVRMMIARVWGQALGVVCFDNLLVCVCYAAAAWALCGTTISMLTRGLLLCLVACFSR